MFNFFKRFKKDELDVEAVVSGQLMPLSEVDDDVFSTKMVGDGYAIRPMNGKIVAPVDGEVIKLDPTKHVICIKNKDGLEVLIHLGLDTSSLTGEQFNFDVKQGDNVRAGQTIGKMDVQAILDSGKDNTVIVVYTNKDKIKAITGINPNTLDRGDQVQTVKLK